MMSDRGGNSIFFLIKIMKIGFPEYYPLLHPLRPITSYFYLIPHSLPLPHLKVEVICVSPLKMQQRSLIKLETCYNRLLESK